MSQQTLQPGAAVGEPPAPFLPDGAEDDSGNNRRNLIIVGAALGVVLIVIVAFFLLKSGGSASSNALVPRGHPHHPPAASAAPASAPITLPRQVSGPVGRDPFKALYVAPVAQPAVADTGTGSTAGSTGTGSGTTVVTTTGGSTGTTSGSTTTSTTTPPAGYSPVAIQLDKVNGTTSATFTVFYSNGKKTTTRTFTNVPVPKGSARTAFATNFSLLSIQDGQATVQYGDSTPFDLARGASNRHALD